MIRELRHEWMLFIVFGLGSHLSRGGFLRNCRNPPMEGCESAVCDNFALQFGRVDSGKACFQSLESVRFWDFRKPPKFSAGREVCDSPSLAVSYCGVSSYWRYNFTFGGPRRRWMGRFATKVLGLRQSLEVVDGIGEIVLTWMCSWTNIYVSG